MEHNTSLSRFLKHSIIALIVLISLTLSGSQNLPYYWQDWQKANQTWQEQYPVVCHSPSNEQCQRYWRQLLSSAMNYNREVNQLPGVLWHRWLHPQLPECVEVSGSLILANHGFSAATSVSLCSNTADHYDDS